MITDAIQSVLNNIVDSYSPIVDSDSMPAGAFAVHTEEVTDVLRDKEGIYGFEYAVNITIVADSQAVIDPLTLDITEAMEQLTGEISGTTIEQSQFKSSMGATWDDDKKKYYDQLTFTVQTLNR